MKNTLLLQKFSTLLFSCILIFISNSFTAKAQDKPVKKDRSYLKKITRLGQARSGILSLQDKNMPMPKRIFSKNGQFLPNSAKVNLDASINVFIINNSGRLYLIDAGLGAPQGEMLSLLEKLEVKKEKIHAVLLTHVHPDHVGGLVTTDGKAVFPNALIYLSTNEYSSVTNKKSPMYHPFQIVQKAYGKRIRPFAAGEKVENIFLSHFTPGHTPGHTVYEYGKFLFIGDLLHSAQLQFADPQICASYDMNKRLAVKYRRKILSYAAAKNLIVAGAHIPFPGTGRVHKFDNAFSFTEAKE